jgi:hypothetical protein
MYGELIEFAEDGALGSERRTDTSIVQTAASFNGCPHGARNIHSYAIEHTRAQSVSHRPQLSELYQPSDARFVKQAGELVRARQER